MSHRKEHLIFTTIAAPTAVLLALAAAFKILFLAPGSAAGQAFWEDAPKIPMAPTWLAEKALLPPYSPPRTPEGVPDLQGVWGAPGGDGLSYLEDHEYIDVTTPAQETFISDPPDGRVPYTPWAMARRNEILAGLARGWPGESGERLYASPSSYCLYFMPEFSFEEVEIVQQPGAVIMLGATGYRVIPTDGRPPFDENAKFWFGISRGRWEGDTLVVETVALTTKSYITGKSPHSDRMTVHERIRFSEPGILENSITVHDPVALTEPWEVVYRYRKASYPNDELREFACAEGFSNPLNH